MKINRSRMKNGNVLNQVILSIVAWTAVIIGGAMITAYLIYVKFASEEIINYGALLTLLVSSFVASMLVVSKNREKDILCAAICALGIVGVLLLSNVLFFGGGITGISVTALVVVAACFCPVLVGRKPKNKRRFNV